MNQRAATFGTSPVNFAFPCPETKDEKGSHLADRMNQ
jgi:hypothetical protein